MSRSDTEQSGSRRDRKAGWLTRFVRAMIYTVLVVLSAIGLLLALLEIDGVLDRAGRWAIQRFSPIEHAQLSTGGISGGLLSGLHVRDVSLRRGADPPMLEVRAVSGRLRLLPLLVGHIFLSDIRLEQPVVRLEQRADSSWDLLAILPADSTTEPTSVTVSGFTVVDGRGVARFHRPGRDSTLVVHRLDLRLAEYKAPRTGLVLDSLNIQFSPPGVRDTVEASIGGTYKDRVVDLRSLRLSSIRSNLVARGRLRFTGERSDFEDLDFSVRAAPLHLRDLHAFFPALNPDGRLEGSAAVRGTSDLIDVSADLDVDDGGELTMRGAISPPGATTHAYDLSVTIRGVDPGRIIRSGPATFSPITATADIALHGPSRSDLSGRAHIVATAFDFGGHRVSPSQATAILAGGEMDLQAAAGIDGAAVEVLGSGRPLDDRPSVRGRVHFTGVDAAQWFGRVPVESNLSGNLDIDLVGKAFQTMEGLVGLELLPSSWGDLAVPAAKVEASVAGGRIDVSLDGSVGGGRLAGSGWLSIEERVSYAIDRLEADALDLAAVAGDTLASSVTGVLKLAGESLDPSAAQASFSIRLDSSSYGDYRMIDGTGDGSLRSGTVKADATLRMKGGSAAISFGARPFDRHPRVSIRTARFDSVDTAALLGSDSWRTSLGGTLTGSIQFSDNGALGNATIRLAESHVNDQRIDRADVSVRFRGDQMSAALDARLPDGRIDVEATGTVLGDALDLQVPSGRIDGIDLGRILASPSLHTSLSAQFRGYMRGDDVASAVAGIELSAAESTVNRDTLRGGTTVVAVDSGRVTLETDLDFGTGHLSVVGTGDVHRDQYEVAGSAIRVNPARLAGIDSLESSVNLDFSASVGGLSSIRTLTAELEMAPSSVGDLTVERGSARLSYRDGVIDIDTLVVESPALAISGGGRLSLDADSSGPASDLALHIETTDLQPLSGLVTKRNRLLAEGSLDVAVTGLVASQRVRLDGRLDRVAFGDLRIGQARIRGVGRLGRHLQLLGAEARLETDHPSLPNIGARSARLDIAYEDEVVHFDGEAIIDDERDATVAGRLLQVGPRPELVLESIRFGSRNEPWELLTESTITVGEEYRISNFLLYSGGQQVALDGFVDFDGEQSLVVSVEELAIGRVADFFGYRGLEGRMSGYVDLTGRADAPRILGSLTADLTSLGKPVGDLVVDLDYADLRLQVDARLRDRQDRTLTVRGFVPVDARLKSPGVETERRTVQLGGAAAQGETDLTIAARDFGIDWIRPYLYATTYSDIGGRLTGDLVIRGTFDRPTLGGSAAVTDGRLGLTEFDVVYHGIQAEARFAGDKVHLDHVEASSGGGSLIGHGTVSLTDLNLGEIDIDFSTEKFLAVDSREYRIVAASDLKLTGTTRRPRIEGTVNVSSADFFLAREIEEFEPVQLTMQDLLTVEQRFGRRLTERDTTTFDFYDAMSMDVRVNISRDTWLRSKKSPTMDIQFTGNLDVSKQPEEDERVFGSIEVLPERSRIEQFGKSFALRKGALTYNGPADDPVLDIEAEYAIRAWRNPDAEVTITLSARGRLDDLDVELASDPTMELTDIVSYIAFGRPASESLHLGGAGQGGSLATDIALGQVAGLIEGVAGSGLGLDVVEIEQQGLDTRLTAGKYVHSRLYLSISQPLSFSGSTSGGTFGNKREITVEFEVLESLLLRILSRRGSISVNLLWQYAY